MPPSEALMRQVTAGQIQAFVPEQRNGAAGRRRPLSVHLGSANDACLHDSAFLPATVYARTLRERAPTHDSRIAG
jgi:hypothetical protein